MKNASDILIKCELITKKGAIDLTEIIESLKYARSTKKDNQLELRIKQDFVNESIDDDEILIGRTIRFQYGFKDQLSKVKLVEIVDLIPEWGERIKFTVIARDKGHAAKKTESNVIWKDKTSSEIAETIAFRHKMKSKIDKTTQKWDNMPQGNKSDYELLRQLAQKEPGYSFYIADKTLYFIKRLFGKTPASNFTYGEGLLISFKVKARESQQDTSSNETTFVGIDPMTGKTNVSSSDDKKDANLGKKGIGIYFASGESAGTTSGHGSGGSWDEDSDGANKVMPDPSGNSNQMKNSANALQQSSLDNALKATFEMIGNPNLEVDELMTVNGIGKRYGGNWYITDITDDISAGGYFKTSGEVIKDGTSKPIKENAIDNTNKVNDKAGTEKKNKKQVPQYDANGKQIN